jgi:alanine dehydrogenase
MKVKILTEKDIRQSVPMALAIPVLKDAFTQLSAGKAVLPLRMAVAVSKPPGRALFMPAYLEESKAIGVKIVSVFGENRARNLPTIHALVVLLDTSTGIPTALLDGTYLTALRTGAVSGLATELLARKNARTAAIFGAGVQGRTQLEAISHVRRIEKAWIYDPDAKAAERFVAEMSTFGSPVPSLISVARSPALAAEEADIICTATTSVRPVFKDSEVRLGTHINGVGSFTPGMQEIPAETVIRAKVVVDSKRASLQEAGDLIIPLRKALIGEGHIYAELGEIAAGRVPGRKTRQEITLFKSVGLAIQDIAVAARVLLEAQKSGLGKEIDI